VWKRPLLASPWKYNVYGGTKKTSSFTKNELVPILS
jgi:hypothetical protein